MPFAVRCRVFHSVRLIGGVEFLLGYGDESELDFAVSYRVTFIHSVLFVPKCSTTANFCAE
jgi:hypothetical protein